MSVSTGPGAPSGATSLPPFPTLRLLVIAGAIFACLVSEFLPTGILPEISAGLGVTEGEAGLLMTAFAFTAMIAAAPMTQLLIRVPRKQLMVATLGAFALTNVVCALAPDYWWLIGARIFGGVAHGVFWGVTAPYASRLVAPQQIVRAVSVANSGAMLAFIFGVPIGAAIGHALGWRAAFAAAAVTIAVFALLVALLLPPVEHRLSGDRVHSASAWKDPTVSAVVMLCLIGFFLVAGQNTLQVYIAPWLIDIGGVDPAAVSLVLFIGGVAGVVGLVMSGVIGDRYPRAGLLTATAAVIAGMVLLAASAGSAWLVLAPYALWMVAYSVVPPLMQGLLVKGASPRIRDIASAVQSSVMNAAIGGGALIGAVAADAIGVAVLPWLAAALMACGFLTVLVARFDWGASPSIHHT